MWNLRIPIDLSLRAAPIQDCFRAIQINTMLPTIFIMMLGCQAWFPSSSRTMPRTWRNTLHFIVSNKNMMRVTRKQTLKVFVIVIPKEGLAGGAPPILLWIWHRLQNKIYEGSRVIFYSRWNTQRRIGGALACQFFFGYDNDKDLKVCFLVMRVL